MTVLSYRELSGMSKDMQNILLNGEFTFVDAILTLVNGTLFLNLE